MRRQLQMSGLISAYDQARMVCLAHGIRNFDLDFLDHLRSGMVVVLPNLFLMAKAVELEGRRGWLIHHAIGDLHTLINLMPYPLPWIVFRRRQDRRLRFYRTDRFIQHATKL